MKVLFATAELAPLARVGGMAEAAAGLVKQLRADGVDVTVVVPDYSGLVLENETVRELSVPEWASPAVARTGTIDGAGVVTLIHVPRLDRPHPYTDADGEGYPDNDLRFFGFSAAVAALVEADRPDVLHLNDWHTSATLGFLRDAPPTVLTIHTLGYQGIAHSYWLDHIPHAAPYFAWYDGANPLAAAIRLADRVITVSPNYAREILTEEHGMGLNSTLAALGDRLVGIINGIDTTEWNPEDDEYLSTHFSANDLSGKSVNRGELLTAFGLDPENSADPVIGIVTRLVDQKGVDLVANITRFLDHVPAQLVVIGSGDAHLAALLATAAERYTDRVGFFKGYDIALAHKVFAGADLLLVPSRFEPCGLAQMQAMAYGTLPIVTDVGGLHDTVIDADRHPAEGTGFVSETVDAAGVIDAIHRAARAYRLKRRRAAMQKRAMNTDWSWAGPAREYEAIYDELAPDAASARAQLSD